MPGCLQGRPSGVDELTEDPGRNKRPTAVLRREGRAPVRLIPQLPGVQIRIAPGYSLHKVAVVARRRVPHVIEGAELGARGSGTRLGGPQRRPATDQQVDIHPVTAYGAHQLVIPTPVVAVVGVGKVAARSRARVGVRSDVLPRQVEPDDLDAKAPHRLQRLCRVGNK